MSRRSLLCLAIALVACGGLAAADAAEHQVIARNFEFVPQDLVIEVGDTVTWTNEGGLHNVNAPGFFRCAEGCDGEGGDGNPSEALWTFSRTFESQAEIDYVCDAHFSLGMVGSVTVVAAGDLRMTVEGTCPGDITVTVTGGTPDGNAGLIFGSDLGTDPLPGGPCAGVASGLSDPAPLAPLALDANGDASLAATVPAAACGVPLQTVDAVTCDTSNVAVVPGGARDSDKGNLRRIIRKRRR